MSERSFFGGGRRLRRVSGCQIMLPKDPRNEFDTANIHRKTFCWIWHALTLETPPPSNFYCGVFCSIAIFQFLYSDLRECPTCKGSNDIFLLLARVSCQTVVLQVASLCLYNYIQSWNLFYQMFPDHRGFTPYKIWSMNSSQSYLFTSQLAVV